MGFEPACVACPSEIARLDEQLSISVFRLSLRDVVSSVQKARLTFNSGIVFRMQRSAYYIR